MKIRSVEVKHVLMEDGTEESTGSTAELHEPASVDVYEKTVGSLTSAMTELNRELRDKAAECDALYETAAALSSALQESDRLLQEKALECERLQLKLQMVCFHEKDDEADPLAFLDDDMPDVGASNSVADGVDDFSVPQLPVAMLSNVSLKGRSKRSEKERKKGPTKAKKTLQGPSVSPVSADTLMEVKMGAPPVDSPQHSQVPVEECIVKECSNEKLNPRGPICVDDESVAVEELPMKSVELGPRQAHFYKVIMERDMAVTSAKKLSRELKSSRKQVRELKSKVERSQALVELSYEESQKRRNVFAKKSKSDRSIGKTPAQESAQSKNKGRNISWLARREQKSSKGEDCVEFIAEDEMLSKKWKAESQQYFQAIASSDAADMAAGQAAVRFQV